MKLVDATSRLVASKLAAAWEAAENRAAPPAEFKQALVQGLSFSESPILTSTLYILGF